MLLDALTPLHYKFSVGGYTFKAEDFGDKYMYFTVKDSGGLEVGSLSVTFDDEGNNVEITDVETPGTLERPRKSGESDSIRRQINKAVKSTL